MHKERWSKACLQSMRNSGRALSLHSTTRHQLDALNRLPNNGRKAQGDCSGARRNMERKSKSRAAHQVHCVA